jgi:hypothetical protein
MSTVRDEIKPIMPKTILTNHQKTQSQALKEERFEGIGQKKPCGRYCKNLTGQEQRRVVQALMLASDGTLQPSANRGRA